MEGGPVPNDEEVVPSPMVLEREGPDVAALSVVASEPDVLDSASTVVPVPSVVEPELARVVIVPCSPEEVEVGSVKEPSDVSVLFSPGTDGSVPDRRDGLVVPLDIPE